MYKAKCIIATSCLYEKFLITTDEVEKRVDTVGNLEEEDKLRSVGHSEEEDELSSAGDSEEEEETSSAGDLEEEEETDPGVQIGVRKIVSE